jgi:hypothetical protein
MMATSDRPDNGRRHFLHRLLALAAVSGLAWVGGCGTKEDKKSIPPNKFPPRPGKSKSQG